MNEQEKKRRQWALIKDQTPDVADFLIQVNKVFGKPAAVRVELASGEEVESGSFDDGCLNPKFVKLRGRRYG